MESLNTDELQQEPNPDEPVTYQFQMPRQDWREWTDSIPRRVTIDDYLRALISHDAAAADLDSANEHAVDRLVMRLRIRLRSSISALRDDADTEEAIEKLEEMQDLVDAMEA